MDRRNFLAGIGLTIAAGGRAEATGQQLRTVAWRLEAAGGLVREDGTVVGAWQGQQLAQDRFTGGRLGVLHLVLTDGTNVLVAVTLHRAERAPSDPVLCAAIGLPGSLWEPVAGRLLAAPVQGGWVVQGTLVKGA